MSFEQIVRPFQRPDFVATKRVIAHAEKVTVGDAIATWGAAGTIAGAQEVEQLDGGFEVITCDDTFDETERKNNNYRVTQKLEDGTEVSDNFIDIKRPYELTFKRSTEDPNYNKTTTWQTSVETASFETTDVNDKKCKSTYKLKIEVPS